MLVEHPIFLSRPIHRTELLLSRVASCGRELAHEARSPNAGPTCQAAECAGSQGESLAIHDHRKGGLQMAKKAKGGKKKAAKKR